MLEPQIARAQLGVSVTNEEEMKLDIKAQTAQALIESKRIVLVKDDATRLPISVCNRLVATSHTFGNIMQWLPCEHGDRRRRAGYGAAMALFKATDATLGNMASLATN